MNTSEVRIKAADKMLKISEKDVRIIYYDLFMSDAERKTLCEKFECMDLGCKNRAECLRLQAGICRSAFAGMMYQKKTAPMAVGAGE